MCWIRTFSFCTSLGMPRSAGVWRIEPADQLAVTILTVEEQLSGWYTLLHSAKGREQLARVYQRLTDNVQFLSRLQILSFSEGAIDRFEQLKGMKLGVKAMDLRIAAVALEHRAILVTRNRRDFALVPGLHMRAGRYSRRAASFVAREPISITASGPRQPARDDRISSSMPPDGFSGLPAPSARWASWVRVGSVWSRWGYGLFDCVLVEQGHLIDYDFTIAAVAIVTGVVLTVTFAVFVRVARRLRRAIRPSRRPRGCCAASSSWRFRV